MHADPATTTAPFFRTYGRTRAAGRSAQLSRPHGDDAQDRSRAVRTPVGSHAAPASPLAGVDHGYRASALTCISPAMVYYSRFYIPEMVLTCLTAGFIVAWVGYRREGSAAGSCAGLLSV